MITTHGRRKYRIAKMRTIRTSTTPTGVRCRHDTGSVNATTSITASTRRRVSMSSLVLLLLFTIASDSMMMRVQAQSSYNNNNDYGYDDDPDDSPIVGASGYAPQPPPVAVDNLYYDYAARQDAKEGLYDGAAAAGGANGYVGLKRCHAHLYIECDLCLCFVSSLINHPIVIIPHHC